MGLLRAAAATAVVAGTAQATRNAVNRHSAEKDAAAYTNAMNQAQVQAAPPPQQQQYYAPPPEAYAPPPAPAPAAAPAGSDLNSQLTQLAQLHTAGVLTDEEFSQAKAKLLAGG